MLPSAIQYRVFDLDAVAVDMDLLSAEERARVERKRTPLLRQRQAASFQCLRETLGAVLGLPPAGLTVARREGGKPYLPGQALGFNLSHSEGIGLLAWGPGELGVDIEALIDRPSEALGREILTAAEFEAWQSQPEALRQVWLTRAWCRKEAVLKAFGEGLRIAPGRLELGGGAGEGRAWVCRFEGRECLGHDLAADIPAGYCAALCLLSS